MTSYEDDRLINPRGGRLGEMTTASHRKVCPLDMHPGDFDIGDIAGHLSRICRYGGAVAGFLSVAEHCVMVARIVEHGDEPWFALEALLHDGMEAYIGDIIRPIKHLPEFKPVLDAEARGEQALATRYGLVWPWPKVVMAADNERLLTEIDELRYNPRANMMPGPAERLFLGVHARLTAERAQWEVQLAPYGIVG